MIRTSILVNGTDIDLFEDISQSYTYAVADIRNPETRNSHHSKTLRLPGSPANDKLFSHIFDIGAFNATSGTINFAPDFNPNLKADCRVFVNSVMVMKGILKLNNIVITDGKIEYECTIWGNTANLFSDLGDKMIADIDFDDLNHTYNRANQRASWTAPVGTGYVYPMIDYGFQFPNQWAVENFYPALYLREYIKRMIHEAGYQVESNWLDSTYAKSLIIPFNGDRMLLTQAQINARKFRASRTGTQTQNYSISNILTTTFDVIYNDDSTSPNEDPGGQYNTANGQFTVANEGYYDFYTEIQFRRNFNSGAGATYVECTPLIYKIDTANNATLIGTGNSLFLLANDNTLQTLYCTASNVHLLANERAVCRIWVQVSQYVTLDFDIIVQPGSYFLNRVINNGIFEGDTVDMNSAIPPNIKCHDLLMSVIKTYNLYLETDKNIDRKLYLEPYNDFYTSGVTRDWTPKIDISQPIDIIPMGMLETKRYVWKFKDDVDYWNAKYKQRWGETYGLKFFDVISDWTKGTKTTEVIFAPTPLALVANTDRIISQIYAVDQAGNKSRKTSQIRILYYGGVKNTNYPWTYVTQSGSFSETQYPYAGHLDDTTSPTYDVNFGVPNEVYYNITSGATYTDGNIYNEYHRQFIDEITDRNSKMVTASFRLTALDISLLDFRDNIFVDGYNFRLNKVLDYSPVVEGLTRVELLKKKQGVPFSRVRVTMGGVYTTMGQDLTPVLSDPIDSGLDNYSGGSPGGPTGRFAGNSRGNRIGNFTSGVTIESSELCSVGDNCARVAVFNSSGVTVYPGLSDVLVLNTSGITIDTSSTSVINNVIQGKGVGWVKTVTSSYTVTPKDSLIFVNNSGAATITLDSTVSDGKEYIVKKISGAGADVTIAGGGLFIDGAGTKVLSTQYNSYTIRKVGNDWFII